MAVTIQVTTDGISFGKEAVEKIQVEQSVYDETIGRFITRINKSNVCKYMVKFIHTLKNLPEQHMIDSVLENFTVLQQIINRDTDELLFCIGVGGKKTLKKILDQTNFFLMLLPKTPSHRLRLRSSQRRRSSSPHLPTRQKRPKQQY